MSALGTSTVLYCIGCCSVRGLYCNMFLCLHHGGTYGHPSPAELGVEEREGHDGRPPPAEPHIIRREQRVPAELLGDGGVHGPREPVDCLGAPCLQGRPEGWMEHLKGISRQSSMKHPQRGTFGGAAPSCYSSSCGRLLSQAGIKCPSRKLQGAHGKAGCSGSGHS